MYLYSVYDSKAESWYAPFIADNAGLACRFLSDSLRGSATVLSNHPDDFSLWRVGSWDPVSAAIVPQIPPEHVSSVRGVLENGGDDGSA